MVEEHQKDNGKKRIDIDWDAIEIDWRVGIKTKLQISEEYGVSRAAIDKRFKKLGIDRDLKAQIKAKADALVTQAAVTREVTFEDRVTDKEVIEANATMQAQAIMGQRTDITRGRKLVMSLLSELEQQTDNLDLYQQLGELLMKPDDKGVDKMNELYHKVISLGGRTGTMKSLADSLKTLVALEREALGIDDRKQKDDSTTYNLTF